VGIVLGSDSDLEVMLEAVKCSTRSRWAAKSSSPLRTGRRRAPRIRDDGSFASIGVLIAGQAAAPPGVLASLSPLR